MQYKVLTFCGLLLQTNLVLAQKINIKQLYVKEYNIYGQMGFVDFDNITDITSQLSPGFTMGVNKAFFPKVGTQYSLTVRLGIEYNYIHYYNDLHYMNGNLDIAPPNINVRSMSNHQITIPLAISLGVVNKHWQYAGSVGLYGCQIFGVKEKFEEKEVIKSIKITDGFNERNIGIEISIGMDRLYTKKIIIEPFSGVYIGLRRSFIGFSEINTLSKPIEIFTRVNLF